MAAYFRSSVREFLEYDADQIIGELTRRAGRSYSTLLASTMVSWERTIVLLKASLLQSLAECPAAGDWGLLLEYEIPRRDRRIDVVLLIGGLVIVIELKTGASDERVNACRQVENYALDLRDFHRQSRGMVIVPVVLLSAGPTFTEPHRLPENELVREVLIANQDSVQNAIQHAIASVIPSRRGKGPNRFASMWDENRLRQRIPTIVEAAQMLFVHQSVREPPHAHADAYNLTKTTDLLVEAPRGPKLEHLKTHSPGHGRAAAQAKP